MPVESVRLQWKSTVLAHIQRIRIYVQIYILRQKGFWDIPLIRPVRRGVSSRPRKAECISGAVCYVAVYINYEIRRPKTYEKSLL